MRLRRLTLTNVRGVASRTVDLIDGDDTTGVVVVDGPNEVGKSSLGDALDVLLGYKASSRAAPVTSLQPTGRDVAPEVEAELQIGEHRIVYRKRFLKRPSTELEWLSPRRKALAGDAAHDQVEALLAEQLDVGLWSSLRLRQGDGLEQAAVGTAKGLAAALERRSDASAIGDGELRILEAARSELALHRTTKGRSTGELRDAELREDEAREALEVLASRMDALSADVAVADRLEAALPGLQRQAEEAEARAKELAEQLEAVERLAGLVDERRAEAETIATSVALLEERATTRAGLVADLTAAEAEAARAADDRTAAEEALEAAAGRLAGAEAAVEGAAAAQRAARALREHAQDDLDHLQQQTDLTVLRARLDRACRARDRVAAADDEVAANPVDGDVLQRVRDAALAADRTRIVLDAASPELRFTADRDLVVGEGGSSVPLRSGDTHEWTVHGALRLQLGDLGEVEVTAGTGTDDAAAAHRDAASALAEALEDAGVEDAEAAEAAHRRREGSLRTAAQAREERDAALAGEDLDDLRHDAERLEQLLSTWRAARPADPPIPGDLAAARELLAGARDAEREADDAVAVPAEALADARADHAARRDAGIELRARAHELERQVTSLRRALEEAREIQPDEKLHLALAEARERLGGAEAALAVAGAELDAADPATVRTLAGNAAAVAEDARIRLDEDRQSLREVRTAIAIRGGEGLHEQREEAAVVHAVAHQRLVGLQRRAAAADLLVATLERHRAAAQERYAAPLRAQLLTFGRILHGPEFDVTLDDDLRVAQRTLDGVTLDVAQLSVGAREQLALLGRLACASLLAETGGLLLLDDALGSSDPERLEAIGAVLALAGEHCQVIVLTCYPDRYRHVGGARRLTLT